MYTIIYYQTRRGEIPVKEFLHSLEKPVQAKFYKWLQRLQAFGPDLPRPFSAPLKDKIRELRVNFGHTDVRVLYFFWDKDYIILTHGFRKKTREVPETEIDCAINYMHDFINRNTLVNQGGK